jgi:hypothetical protein
MSIHSVDISLDNVDSKETFEHSVILLKGKVTCQENCCKALLNGKISVSIESEVFDFDVKEGRFKCIVELELGLNFLKIIYNNDLHLGQYTLTLERKSSLCDKVLKLLYVVPKGESGEFQSVQTCSNSAESACKRITTGVKLLQCLVSERLSELGLGKKTFNLFTQNEKEECEVFYSQHTKEEFFSCTSEGIWIMTARELLNKGIFAHGVKVLAFLSCTEYFEETNEIKGYVACGRGHLAMVSSSGLHSWASNVSSVVSCLTSPIPIDSSLLDDSGFR